VNTADVDLAVLLHVRIVRQPRARCAVCRIRRVLYRVQVNAFGAEPGLTEARCAPCWNISLTDEA